MPVKLYTWIALLFLVLASLPVAGAQETAPGDTPVEDTAAALAAPGVSGTGPVVVPEASEKAMRYYRSGNWLWVLSQLWSLAATLLILFTGLSAHLRNWAKRIGRKWFFTVGIYCALFTVVSFLLELPLSFYTQFVRQHAYDLSNQTLGKWGSDTAMMVLVAVIAGGVFLWVPYLVIAKSPRRWWLYTTLLVPPFLCFMLLVKPLWVDPLFNEFGPMQDKVLEARILAVAERAGIENSRVFEVNKSVDTKAVNAYVTGFLGSKRIVLWDTIIDRLDPDELLFVMGHEMGHYVLGHVVRMIALSSLLIGIALYLVHRLSGGLIQRFEGRFGFSELSDVASLPLILVLANVLTLLLTPIALAQSRHYEHESDRFGVELMQNNHAAATAFLKLQEQNLANPRPGLLFKIWRGSHPSIGERVDFLNAYRPWETSEALKYGGLFHEGAEQE